MHSQFHKPLVCRRLSRPLRSLLALAAVAFLGLWLAPHAKAQPAGANPAKAQVQAAAGPAPMRATGTSGPVPAQSATAMGKSGSGQHEGITTHGHWVIEVMNPDGTLSQRREFENSLTQNGQTILTGFLGGNFTPGGWWINLLPGPGDTASPPCQNTYGFTSPLQPGCLIFEPNNTYDLDSTNGNFSCGATPTGVCNLVVTTTSGLVLSGTAAANQTGDIGTVSTHFEYSSGGTRQPTSANSFTSTNLSSPILSIQSGQTINVTVTITFSSGS
jgi:hypothetical protein